MNYHKNYRRPNSSAKVLRASDHSGNNLLAVPIKEEKTEGYDHHDVPSMQDKELNALNYLKDMSDKEQSRMDDEKFEIFTFDTKPAAQYSFSKQTFGAHNRRGIGRSGQYGSPNSGDPSPLSMKNHNKIIFSKLSKKNQTEHHDKVTTLGLNESENDDHSELKPIMPNHSQIYIKAEIPYHKRQTSAHVKDNKKDPFSRLSFQKTEDFIKDLRNIISSMGPNEKAIPIDDSNKLSYNIVKRNNLEFKVYPNGEDVTQIIREAQRKLAGPIVIPIPTKDYATIEKEYNPRSSIREPEKNIPVPEPKHIELAIPGILGKNQLEKLKSKSLDKFSPYARPMPLLDRNNGNHSVKSMVNLLQQPSYKVSSGPIDINTEHSPVILHNKSPQIRKGQEQLDKMRKHPVKAFNPVKPQKTPATRIKATEILRSLQNNKTSLKYSLIARDDASMPPRSQSVFDDRSMKNNNQSPSMMELNYGKKPTSPHVAKPMEKRVSASSIHYNVGISKTNIFEK